MRISVMYQVLIGDYARGTIIAGTVDDNLIILGKLGQRFLLRGKVKRAGNVLRAVLPVPQGHHQLKPVSTLHFLLQFLPTDELHVIFHDSISSSCGCEHVLWHLAPTPERSTQMPTRSLLGSFPCCTETFPSRRVNRRGFLV